MEVKVSFILYWQFLFINLRSLIELKRNSILYQDHCLFYEIKNVTSKEMHHALFSWSFGKWNIEVGYAVGLRDCNPRSVQITWLFCMFVWLYPDYFLDNRAMLYVFETILWFFSRYLAMLYVCLTVSWLFSR